MMNEITRELTAMKKTCISMGKKSAGTKGPESTY